MNYVYKIPQTIKFICLVSVHTLFICVNKMCVICSKIDYLSIRVKEYNSSTYSNHKTV